MRKNLLHSTRYGVNLRLVSVDFTSGSPCKHTYPAPPKGSLPRHKRYVAYITASRLSKMLTANQVTEMSCAVAPSTGAGSGTSSSGLGATYVAAGGGGAAGGVSMSPANAGQQSTSNRTDALRDFRIIRFLCGLILWANSRPRARVDCFSVSAKFLQRRRRACLT